MSGTDTQNLSRREATGKLLKIICVATGLSLVEVQTLLAQSKYKPRQQVIRKPLSTATPTTTTRPQSAARQLIVDQKCADPQLSNLKTLLENSVTVFENEFGRTTPTQTIRADQLWDKSQLSPDMLGQIINVCGTNFDPMGGMGLVGLVWCSGKNSCNGQDLTGSDPDGQGCDGTNVCNGQSCPKHEMCSDNTCTDQDCPNFKICQPKNSESLVTADFLNDAHSSLYVQLLFKEFNVSTAAQLADAINATLHDLAAGKAVVWPPN